MDAPGRLPLAKKVLYALGNGGAVLGDSLIASWLLYFYFPPEGRAPDLVPKLLLAIVPSWLLVNLIARGVDAVADPLVAVWSDRSTHPLGRRRVFMLAGAIPLAVATGLLFFPPGPPGSLLNLAFLVVVFCAYFFLFTIYVAPYLALLPELGGTPEERLDLSTMLAVAALVGAGVAMVGGPALMPLFASEDESGRVQRMAVVLAVLSGLLLVLPAIFVKERRYAQAGAPQSTLGLLESLKATVGDRSFRLYLTGTILFWFGFNVVRGATPYFVTVLMKEPLDFQVPAMAAVFVVAGLCFPLINLLAKRLGKARTMLIGSAVLAVGLLAVPLISGRLSGIVILAICGAGVGVLLSVPNAMLADICEQNAARTGERREAMFFGAQGFFLKLNLGLSSGILGLLFALFGNGEERPLGVMLSGPVGAVALGLSIWAFARFGSSSSTLPDEGGLPEGAGRPTSDL